VPLSGRMMTLLAPLRAFLRLESAPGIVLVAAAALALLANNSPLAPWYDALLDTPASVRVGTLGIDKPLLLWINDGLMAVFFLLVGLEIKREMLEGELSRPGQLLLPALAAVAGMLVPAAVFAFFNRHDPTALPGWAIPSATDIAFALGVLSLLGSRVPVSLKVLLTAIAVLDDLGAIVIIAIFYTADLSTTSLVLAAIALVGLAVLNRAGVRHLGPYILVGLFLWACVLKSGVHATLAGVALGLSIPLRNEGDLENSPLRELEHALHSWVGYGILPLFAFANAGVSFAGIGPDRLVASVPLGIALGLFLGKQIGIFGAIYALVKLRITAMPAGATWTMIYGIALLCGIGFTMSLFIGTLAYDSAARAADVRLGVIVGSLLSATVGYLVLSRAVRQP
jgi:NhaA family Na+:H+ antiporter